jgi:hypothetical protein
MSAPLTTNLDDEQGVPYFLWDDPMTLGELRERLRTASEPERDRLLGKILREARDTDVWRFITPQALAREFHRFAPHLGRRKAFWEYTLRMWREVGMLE